MYDAYRTENSDEYFPFTLEKETFLIRTSWKTIKTKSIKLSDNKTAIDSFNVYSDKGVNTVKQKDDSVLSTKWILLHIIFIGKLLLEEPTKHNRREVHKNILQVAMYILRGLNWIFIAQFLPVLFASLDSHVLAKCYGSLL